MAAAAGKLWLHPRLSDRHLRPDAALHGKYADDCVAALSATEPQYLLVRRAVVGDRAGG